MKKKKSAAASSPTLAGIPQSSRRCVYAAQGIRRCRLLPGDSPAPVLRQSVSPQRLRTGSPSCHHSPSSVSISQKADLGTSQPPHRVIQCLIHSMCVCMYVHACVCVHARMYNPLTFLLWRILTNALQFTEEQSTLGKN